MDLKSNINRADYIDIIDKLLQSDRPFYNDIFEYCKHSSYLHKVRNLLTSNKITCTQLCNCLNDACMYGHYFIVHLLIYFGELFNYKENIYINRINYFNTCYFIHSEFSEFSRYIHILQYFIYLNKHNYTITTHHPVYLHINSSNKQFIDLVFFKKNIKHFLIDNKCNNKYNYIVNNRLYISINSIIMNDYIFIFH